MPLPWTQIIQWVPPIIELSRDLLVKSKRVPPMPPSTGPEINVAELAGRVAALEENERRQAELVSQMAEHQGQLSTAVVELHRETRRLARWLLAVAALLTVAVALLAVVTFRS